MINQHKTPQAFTLIELLVVVSIIALLSSMISIIPNHEDAEEQIALAAAQVEGIFKQARKLALETKNTYAVAIHIENSGDSSVFKNYSQTYDGAPNGRHWIAIIGPDFGFASKSRNEPPIPNAIPHLQAYEDNVNTAMINKVYLPPGTRFLAIGDLDKGNKEIERYYADRGDEGPSYNRPWFGYFKDGRLYPWGAYDHEIDVDYRASNTIIKSCVTGLLYEGADGEIPYDPVLDTCVNPNPTYGNLFPHVLKKSPVDGGGTRDSGQKPDATVVGKARALLNGNSMEYAFIFTGNGDCFTYQKSADVFYDHYRGDFSIGHETLRTGGYYVTVARDIDPAEDIYKEVNAKTGQPDYTLFDSEEDALKSISPFRRIFIHTDTGAVITRNPYHEEAYLEAEHLLQKDPYPTKVIPTF